KVANLLRLLLQHAAAVLALAVFGVEDERDAVTRGDLDGHGVHAGIPRDLEVASLDQKALRQPAMHALVRPHVDVVEPRPNQRLSVSHADFVRKERRKRHEQRVQSELELQAIGDRAAVLSAAPWYDAVPGARPGSVPGDERQKLGPARLPVDPLLV